MDKYEETIKTWNKLAKLYEEKFMHLDLYNDSYDRFCARLKPENAAILEVGCGPGNISSYLLRQHPDYKIEGIDVAPNMVDLAKKNNPSAHYMVMDARDIKTIPNKYDGIVTGFCIPYLTQADCSDFIKSCAALLENEGVLYLSFVEGEPENSGYQTGSSGDSMYFNFYSLSSLVQMLELNHFKVEECLKISYQKSADTEDIHTVLIATKNPSH